MICLEHVTRNYGRRTAVENLSLDIPPGELFAFLGPNGAGKTTTIKMLVGLLRPTQGSVTVCGVDVTRRREDASQQVGYVPDQPFLYDKLTGREFLEFAAGLHGMSQEQIDEQLSRQIDLFSLAAFVDELCENYSHGMKQRVVFASALMHRPRVLIVDEPMVGLDPRSMRLVKDLLASEAAAGTSVFMSTHTLSIAEEVADRIGVIGGGRLQFLGTVDALREALDQHDSNLEELFLRLTEEQSQPQGPGAAEPRADFVPEGLHAARHDKIA